MKIKIALLTFCIPVLSCRKGIDLRVVDHSAEIVDSKTQIIKDALETSISFKFSNEELCDVMHFLHLKMFESIERKRNGGAQFDVRNWNVHCSDSVVLVSKEGNGTIISVIQEICKDSQNIAIFDKQGWVVVPRWVILDKSSYYAISDSVLLRK